MAMLRRIAIIEITTKSSTRVKPFFMTINNLQKSPQRGAGGLGYGVASTVHLMELASA
jgi:hypothetical protein